MITKKRYIQALLKFTHETVKWQLNELGQNDNPKSPSTFIAKAQCLL